MMMALGSLNWSTAGVLFVSFASSVCFGYSCKYVPVYIDTGDEKIDRDRKSREYECKKKKKSTTIQKETEVLIFHW